MFVSENANKRISAKYNNKHSKKQGKKISKFSFINQDTIVFTNSKLEKIGKNCKQH